MPARPELETALQPMRTTFGDRALHETHEPGDAYDAARMVHNGLVDKRPACIFRCTTAAEVVSAIGFARAHALEISVKGGGHNVGGRAVTEGGVMIDLSLMKRIDVDAAARTATVEPGVTWGELNAATLAHGLATTGGVISSTGVAGLTLGGGLGWLMALHGLAIDNLLGAEIVTADGRVLRASASENQDLFWAIRGGGGNFGVATSFMFRLHPVRDGIGGLVAHPLDAAPAMLRFFRDITSNAPDELSVFGGVTHAPDGSGNKIGVMVAYHPDPVAGMDAVAPIKAFGPPIMDVMGPTPYAAVNQMLDGGFPRGALNYWKSSFLESLTDEAITTIVEAFRECPAPLSAMLLEHFHGAVTRVAPDATAYPHRQKGYNLLIAAQWMDPSQSDACIAWARRTYDAIAPYMATAKYVNYLGDDAPRNAVADAYGANFARLVEVKSKYDPTNLFRLNQNIPPSPKS